VLREAHEETGLSDLRLISDLIHVVVVPVPAALVGGPEGQGGGRIQAEPAHEHADLRYVLATGNPDAARPENPQSPLRWLTFDEARELVGRDVLSETLSRAQSLIL
jgi:8-oxo-dGTP pyrophosphatase MutT (NUDIX family)